MKQEVKINPEHMPNFTTFPLTDTIDVEPDSKVTIPSEDAVDDVKDWVDFKEMQRKKFLFI